MKHRADELDSPYQRKSNNLLEENRQRKLTYFIKG